MATVTFDKATRIYPGGDKPAVDALDLQIKDGEFLVLVGPSGCGKTTSLRMLAGLEDVNGGRILIGDRDVTHEAPKDRDIAMVFQNYALYPHMSVYDNMAYGLRNRGVDKATIEVRVAEAARMLEIGPFLDRRPRALSGGQRQRVAMGRAVVREPQAFLFDEPLSNLDAKLRVQMRLEIRRLHNRLKATSIFVTHDQVEAMTLADVVVVMNGGRIEQTGTPLDVYRNPASKFVATFIGSPAMNLVQGKIIEAGVVECDGGGRFPYEPAAFGGLAGQAVDIGVRPEDITLAPAGATHTAALSREFVEELGATRLIHGLVGGRSAMVMSLPSAAAGLGNDTLKIQAAASAVHLFDPATGSNMRR